MTRDQDLAECTEHERALVVVRLAIQAFGDGDHAGNWLLKANGLFDGVAPLVVARLSVEGCARVCSMLDELAEKNSHSA